MKQGNKDIDLSIFKTFQIMYPNIDIQVPKWAMLGVAFELRRQQVGEIILFPIDKYNYQTIRATPSSSLLKEHIYDGREWKTKVDHINKSIAVIRIA